MTPDRLTDELRALGRDVDPAPDLDALSERIMRRVEHRDSVRGDAALPTRRRRNAIAAAVVAVLIALALTPPVRAAVTEWFGVVVRSGPAVEPEPVPTAGADLTVSEATDLAGFEPVVPQPLGAPDEVSVSSDAMVITMSWSQSAGTIRLDQFEGTLEPRLVKQTPGVEFVQLDDGSAAVWFPEPHRLLRLTEDGERPELSRAAAPTLLWQEGEITLRLEGLSKQRSVEVAEAVAGAR